jgi:Ca2+-binding RTX toxin-like protein
MIETLEPRRLFSVSIANGQLHCVGKFLTNDEFIFAVVGNGTQLRVAHLQRFTSTIIQDSTFNLKQFIGITIDLGPGDDRVAISSGSLITEPFTIRGGPGDDLIAGGHLADVISGGGGNDTISGNGGPDVIHGDAGNDLIFGNAGNDNLFGEDGNDELHGNDGNDHLAGGAGADKLFGEAGDDLAVDDTNGSIVDLGTGTDGLSFDGTLGDDAIQVRRRVTATGPVCDFILNGVKTSIAYANGETITINGRSGNDYIAMDESAGLKWKARFFGQAGNDLLIGAQQDDFLDGGTGVNLLIGKGGVNDFRRGNVVG